MKIKRKVQKTLPQLIEWGFDNPDLSNDMSFLSDDWENVRIDFKFNPRGVLSLDILNGRNISDDILFTVEEEIEITVEEEIEITEDTVIPKSLVMFEHNGNTHIEKHDSKCINDILCLDKKVKGSVTKTIHVMNNDLTLTLIWRDGELVEQ